MRKKFRGLRGMMRGVGPNRSILTVFVLILCVSLALPTVIFAQDRSDNNGEVAAVPSQGGAQGEEMVENPIQGGVFFHLRKAAIRLIP